MQRGPRLTQTYGGVMKSVKGLAIAMAAIMLLSVGIVLGAANVQAADFSVEIVKPNNGAKMIMGKSYDIAWSFPNGGESQIYRIYAILGQTEFFWSVYDGTPVPTSCTLKVYESQYFHNIYPGENVVEVYVYLSDGNEAYDSNTVYFIDHIKPVFYDYLEDIQIVAFGTDTLTHAMLCDGQFLLDPATSVKVLVDGKTAPSDEVTFEEVPDAHMWFDFYMNTDWLSLGKHKVTLIVTDSVGNTARLSWFVQVVNP